MKGWRYIAQRLPDGAFLDWSVPLEDVQITDVLSGDNSLSGTIPVRYNRLLGPDGLPIIKPWATALWAEKDGEIRGGGIVNEVDPDGGTLSVDCVGYTGYAKDMPYTGSGYAKAQVDPLDVVRVIWTHIQSQPNGNLGLILSTLKTGLKIGTQLTQAEYDGQSGPYTYDSGPYKLAWYQDNDLSSNISDLASSTPFDYHERHQWDGDTLKHYLDFGYPKIGRQRDDLRFVLGENILASPQVSFTGDDYATDVLVLGSGEGATQVMAMASGPRSGLRRVAVVTDSSIKYSASFATVSLADLEAGDYASGTTTTSPGVNALDRAKAELAWRRNIQEIDSFVVRDHPSAPLGSFAVGDTIYVQGRLDWAELGTWMRVTQIVTTPSDPNNIEITVTRTDKLTS